MAETPTESDAPKSAAAKLFDIRLLIGLLFVVYGVMLTVAGFLTSAKQRAKAADININLWLGIGMLVLGLLFLLWRMVNPTVHPDSADAAGEDGHVQH
jgi:quinol-cytochrome oxidoreductase complex cytochrome b subunit